jgi:hypothetical protein
VGRHGGKVRRRGLSGQVVLIACAVLLVLAVGGVIAVNVIGPEPVSTRASASTGSSSSPGEPDESAASDSETSPTASSTSMSPQAALAACRAEVAAGTEVADAAARSADDWSAHVDAQHRLDAGSISATDAEATWRRTKASGKKDVSRFAEARSSLKEADGACRKVVDRTIATPYADKAAFCSERNDALSQVISTGGKVDRQLREHLDAIGDQPHVVGSLGATWTNEVAAAGPALAAFDKAVEELHRSAPCPT